MKHEALTPHLPFHDDEVSQGYFARTGYFHAGVPVGTFCRFLKVGRVDFRDGTDAFTQRMAEMSGGPADGIRFNTLKVVSGDWLQLRGERLGMPVVRRTYVRFCPQCMQDDMATPLASGPAAARFRWAWLFRPVVTCARHGVLLAEMPAPDPVKAFDLPKLFAENEIRLSETTKSVPAAPGHLQKYVEDRLWGVKDAAPWMDGQGIAAGAKACEMLGALLDAGPNAPIGKYTELDWARVGDIGFAACSRGPRAILDALAQLRIGGGRRSGRAGPQSAYGFLFNWLNYTQRADDFGAFRQVVRDAILDNFAVGPGEVVLGEEVVRRRMHSVNSLVNATGINRFRLYRLMRKAGMIPETADKAAFNQWVFPAEDGEKLIARIENSVPLNQIQHVLGCSKTHAEQLAHQGLVSSVVPISQGSVGLTQGHFNRDDLASFMSEVLRLVEVHDAEEKGFVDLSSAARPRSSTAEILRWLLDGKLPGTRLLYGTSRLDHLRFDHEVVKALVTARRAPDLHRLTSVAVMLGVHLKAVKALISHDDGGPWLVQAPADICSGLDGGAYVSSTEMARFQADYASIAMVARTVGIHARSVQRMLEERGVWPIFNPDRLGSRIYRQADVAGFMAEVSGKLEGVPRAVFVPKAAVFAKNGQFGESDDTFL